MAQKDKNIQGVQCGITASGKFVGDMCPKITLTFWKCSNCSYTITASKPPDICPECQKSCVFKNITCYTPNCGGSGNIDPRL